MPEALRELWQYRELLLIFVRRDLKVRYKNSVLGFGWSLANPLLQVFIITVVVQFMAARSSLPKSYHAYVFCATLPWMFFATAVQDATNSLVGHYGLIRKTYFPREILPLSTVVANILHLALAGLVFVAYITANSLWYWAHDQGFNYPIQPSVLLSSIPLLGMVLVVSGMSLFLSVWTLYFEDMRFLVDSGVRIVYWLVPVLYFPDSILHRNPFGLGRPIYVLYMLNPLAAFINAFRKLTLVPTSVEVETATGPVQQRIGIMMPEDWLFLGIGLVTSLLIAVLGQWYFSRRKWGLAERG